MNLAEAGNYQEALTATERSIDIQPNFSLAWTSKSGILVMLGKYSEALNASEKAIALQPDDVYAYCNKADALLGLGRYDEAVRQRKKRSLSLPDSMEAQKIKARAMSVSAPRGQRNGESDPCRNSAGYFRGGYHCRVVHFGTWKGVGTRYPMPARSQVKTAS